MKTLTELNKFNASLLAQVENLSWDEATALGQKYLANTTAYKNALLKSIEGRNVTVKGYVVNKTDPLNYTIGNARIYVDGGFIDTLQHISVYADLLSSEDLFIGGNKCKGEGNYSLRELTSNLRSNIENNVPYLNCEEVEFSGISYSYVNRGFTKYSIGTIRQVNFASNNKI